MRTPVDFLKKCQAQFELAERPAGFPPKIFSILYRWNFEPGSRSLRKLAHYKQGFPELKSGKRSEVQTRNCWNVLTNAVLLEGYGNNDYTSVDLESPAGDLFHLANNPSLFPPWHGAMLAATHLNMSLLTLLLLWKGDVLASKCEALDVFYFKNEPIRGESADGRELMESLRAGEAFTSPQLRDLFPFLEGAVAMPGASDDYRGVIQALYDKGASMEEQWAQEAEMEAALAESEPEPEEAAAAAPASPVALAPGAVVVAGAPAAAAAPVALAYPTPQDPFLQTVLPSPTWVEAVRAMEARQYSKAAELLEAETRRINNPSRMQFVAYLCLARCWFDQGELDYMTPTLRLLWREVRKYGDKQLGEDLVDDLPLFRWEPALLGELARLTVAYFANKDEYEIEETTGYRMPIVQHLALSAGLSFLSSKGI